MALLFIFCYNFHRRNVKQIWHWFQIDKNTRVSDLKIFSDNLTHSSYIPCILFYIMLKVEVQERFYSGKTAFTRANILFESRHRPIFLWKFQLFRFVIFNLTWTSGKSRPNNSNWTWVCDRTPDKIISRGNWYHHVVSSHFDLLQLW